MINKTPNVIYKNKFSLSLNNPDNKNTSSSYKMKRLKDIDCMIDYFSDEKKKAISMYDYYNGITKDNYVNLVMENGKHATKEEVEKIKKDYKKYIENSNLWKGILSFPPEFINQNISLETLEKVMAKDILPRYFKHCGFKDTKNMSFVFSIHSNKEHPHIHFAFAEKKPNYIGSRGKTIYRRKGQFTNEQQRFLKRQVELSIVREKIYEPLITDINYDIMYLKQYFKNDKNCILKNINEIYVEEKILRLGQLLSVYRESKNQTSKKIKYNSIKDGEIRKLTKEIKKYLFSDETSELYQCKKKFDDNLDKLNNYFNELNKDNNVDEVIKDNSLVESKRDYVDNYIYNAIVNHSLYRYNKISFYVKKKNEDKDKITIDDLIQEVSYLNSLGNRKLDNKAIKEKVLKNYLKGSSNSLKFPSKYKLESNLKRLNYEMEQAAQEFSKLFDYSTNNSNLYR